jgi:hypothetical protein
MNTQQTRQLYINLPKKIKVVISSPELTEKINKLTDGINLTSDQKKIIHLHINNTIMRVEQERTLISVLLSIGITENLAKNISDSIEKNILNNIDNLYQEIIDASKKEDIENGVIDFDENEEYDVEEEAVSKPQIPRGLDKISPIAEWSEVFFNTPHIHPLDEREKEILFKKVLDVSGNKRGMRSELETSEVNPYLIHLPEYVRDTMYAGVWLDKTREIAQKYSLTESQAELCIKQVLYVLIGLLDGQHMIDTFVSDLDVSIILGTQIIEDIEKRIFNVLLEQKDKVYVPKKTPLVHPLDIPPLNLPSEELDVLPIAEPTKTPPIVTPPSFVSVKLTQPTTAETNKLLERKDIPNIKPYTSDPYREPLE